MSKSLSSYLIRCWKTSSGLQRVEVLHIQTGEKKLVSSLEGAVDWLKLTCTDTRGRSGGELLGTEGVTE